MTSPTPEPKTRRRGLFLGLVALAGGAVLARPLLDRLIPVDLDLMPIDAMPGFRRLSRQGGGADLSLFYGLQTGDRDRNPPDVASDLCTNAFEHPPRDGEVPIAVFSDFRCSVCRILEPRVMALAEAAGPGVRLVWHQLPLLGEPSVLAARGALAARRQGAYLPFHERLMATSFVPTQGLIDDSARALGLDVAQLRRDMSHPAVEDTLARSKAVADLFGFIGTPAMLVGRTAVLGAVDDRTLRALVERERRDGPLPCARA